MFVKRKAGEGTIFDGYLRYRIGSVGSWKGKKYKGAKHESEHNRIAAQVLGRPLRAPEEVHHVNGKGLDNRHENLVICPNRAYHMLLHQRADAFDACGHADWLHCPYCDQYDDPKNMAIRPRGKNRPGQFQWNHAECARQYANARYPRKVAYKPRLAARTHA